MFLQLVFGLISFGSISCVFRQREIHGSSLSLSFEWDDPVVNLTEADYYSYSDAAETDGNAKRFMGGRPGHSTSTHSCNYIRGVPGSLRSSSNIGPRGLDYFYQQYTEAYGIPVLASQNVPADAVRRACYVLRVLLADHAGIRESYYRYSGRVAVIGAREGTTSIPEHSHLGSWWNDRARGLGATVSAPVSTGGEENVLCYTNDRYRVEDIFLHEFSHGVHLLGAKYVIPGWQGRLESQYRYAQTSGLWANTYAMSTVEEYFAEGTQSFFNVNGYANPPNGIHNHVNTREKLRSYDPQLYRLIQEVFPCENDYIKRCSTSRDRELNQQLRMDCQPGGSGTHAPVTNGSVTNAPATSQPITGDCKDNNGYCASWAQQGECAANPAYMHLNCRWSCNLCAVVTSLPTTNPPITNPPTTNQPITNPPVTNPPTTSQPITNPPTARPTTAAPVTGTCTDNNGYCASWATQGECSANPAYMHLNCRRSCNLCGHSGSSCVDTGLHCVYWSKTGECARNAAYMNTSCRRSCNLC